MGILAKVSEQCAKSNANIVDVTQTILQDLFVMIMMVDISEISCDFGALSDALSLLGKEMGLDIHIMHEDIFNSMHKI